MDSGVVPLWASDAEWAVVSWLLWKLLGRYAFCRTDDGERWSCSWKELSASSGALPARAGEDVQRARETGDFAARAVSEELGNGATRFVPNSEAQVGRGKGRPAFFAASRNAAGAVGIVAGAPGALVLASPVRQAAAPLAPSPRSWGTAAASPRQPSGRPRVVMPHDPSKSFAGFRVGDPFYFHRIALGPTVLKISGAEASVSSAMIVAVSGASVLAIFFCSFGCLVGWSDGDIRAGLQPRFSCVQSL